MHPDAKCPFTRNLYRLVTLACDSRGLDSGIHSGPSSLPIEGGTPQEVSGHLSRKATIHSSGLPPLNSGNDAPGSWGVFQDRSVLRGGNPCWMSALDCMRQSRKPLYRDSVRAISSYRNRLSHGRSCQTITQNAASGNLVQRAFRWRTEQRHAPAAILIRYGGFVDVSSPQTTSLPAS